MRTEKRIDLISREDAINAINEMMNADNFDNGYLINRNDAVSVLQHLPIYMFENESEWVIDPYPEFPEITYYCDGCGHIALGDLEKTRFCPGCGAAMKNPYDPFA